ncbi:MAG: hypothetical protein ACREJU_06320 [Nitrospiraceae bacterium]
MTRKALREEFRQKRQVPGRSFLSRFLLQRVEKARDGAVLLNPIVMGRPRGALFLFVWLVAFTAMIRVAQGQENGQDKTGSAFQCMATHRGIGAVLASLVGPGPRPGSERFYQSYIYGNRLDIVAVDPDSGDYETFSSPVPGENGAWALAWGPDGNLYVGTLPHARLFQLDPRAGTLADVGRPSDSEEYIWKLALGADGKLYGGTYPSAKLIRYDPATGRSDDLGSMDPTEQYAVSIAGSDDGFIYIGIGYGTAHLIAYNIASDHHRDILPVQYQTTGAVYVRRHGDGRVYAGVAGQSFQVQGWTLDIVDATQVPAVPFANRLLDGRLVVQAGDGTVRVFDPQTNTTTERPFRYAGKDLDVFRLGRGPDGMLYGSGYMPARFFRVDPSTGELEDLGILGDGEFYNFLEHGRSLVGATYAGMSPLMVYDPNRPFAPGKGADANPFFVDFPGQVVSWRPIAMINGADGHVYVGAQADYGKLGGPLTVWDPATNQVEIYHHLIPDQSVVSLATVQGWVIGGTTIHGGGGSHETEEKATLFIWDPMTKQTIFRTPVNASTITNLIAASGDRIYGFADATLFVFEPTSRRLTMTSSLIPDLIYNSVALDPEGVIWGVSREGIFTIDPATDVAQLLANAPERITAGFAVQWPSLYYASGPKICRYEAPRTLP